MPEVMEISLFGELKVISNGREVPLPASRKARALLAFLVATGRPHRRERLCEMLWDLPDDPKAALRWSLSKLRKVVDTETQQRIIADRERVQFDMDGVEVDVRSMQACLRDRNAAPSVETLERLAGTLSHVFLDGLDGAGDDAFDNWLTAEREDARIARVTVLKSLAGHPEVDSIAAQKWLRLWQEEDPEGAEGFEREVPNREASKASAPRQVQPTRSSGPVPTFDDPSQRIANARARSLQAQRIGFCEVQDGTKIAYASIGEGPPLLKAANWLNHLEFDWSSPIWGKSFAEIARTRTFIRYDERGCGLSDWDVDDLSFDAFVEDLEAVADKLGLKRFPLLGISQGAAVSIEYAVRHPERVSGLILIGGYAAGWRHLATPEEQARREAVLTLTEVGWGTDNPAYRHIFSQTFMPEATQEDLAWFDEFQRLTTSPANAARFQNAFGHIDVRDRLKKVKAPTLVLHSRHDQRIPLDLGRELAAGIPDAHFVPLESRNHILMDTEPAWLHCVQASAAFLAEHRI
ncbi:alpha/beta fold hydrolase [Psychromarinibacter halotolerans]